MRAIKREGNYRLYRVDGMYELWSGVIGKELSYRAGYVSNPDNFEEAIYAAQEEMHYMMAEAF